MELVPFIYTILKVVAVLAIATLIISYISFRNKLKNGTLDQHASNNEQRNMSPVVVPLIRQVQNNDELLPQPVIKKVSAKEDSRQKENHRKESAKEQSTSRKTKSGKTGHSKRLQIIKELQPVKNKKTESKEELQPAQKTSESLKSLDEDIISKYDEQDENDFHVLSVKDRKDKHAK
ncbi:MAG: hypothetical protein M1480_16370 [Bacteroidetes bacterium]|nr:hypothetical protein [Bacteroidota bacterium]